MVSQGDDINRKPSNRRGNLANPPLKSRPQTVLMEGQKPSEGKPQTVLKDILGLAGRQLHRLPLP